MAQITRKDVESCRNDEEERAAQRLAERRRQEETLLRHIKDQAAELGRRLESTPKWGQEIEKLHGEVLGTLAKRGSEAPIRASVSFSTAPWRWRRRWRRLADLADECQIYTAPSILTKSILEGGLKRSIGEDILPIAYAHHHKTERGWELILEFLPPKN